jgi:methionyl aminopeptidase
MGSPNRLIKTPAEIETIARAGVILRGTLDILKREIKPGVSLAALDALAEKIIRKNGGIPAFLHYHPYGAEKPFPATICASVNDVVVHGLPTSYIIKNGDVVSIDCGVKIDGWYSDAAFTVVAGKGTKEAEHLVRTTEEALERGIAAARAGNTVGDIGHAIGSYIKAQKLHVIKGLTGHGVGTDLHEEPSIFNDGKPGTGLTLRAGMVIAIEPMVAIGTATVEQLADDSFATADGSRAAHFEKTIAITNDEPRILT